MKACKQCHLIIETPETAACPVCQGTEFSEKFNSIAMIFDAEKSEIAARLGAKAPGRYAIKVRER